MIGSVEYLLITIIIYIFSENLRTIANLLLQLITLLRTKTTLSKKKKDFWSKRYTCTEYIQTNVTSRQSTCFSVIFLAQLKSNFNELLVDKSSEYGHLVNHINA